MPYESFDKLNHEREVSEEPLFANPRNAASGSLKLQDPEEVGRRGLFCTLYHIPTGQVDFPTHDAALSAAASWGLPVSSDRRICHNIREIEAFIAHWDTARKDLPYATDGIVIKINEMAYQQQLGYTAKSPRWAVAYKFKAEQACTPILPIDYPDSLLTTTEKTLRSAIRQNMRQLLKEHGKGEIKEHCLPPSL